ncbi:hypothetical protein CE91St62_37130 [Lachnospiraceae bacterium]|uniref:ATP synthase delta subunit family protein n=1 Tax=Extibacter sp. GGCC_0201 TaxID=2731209 RepID=UPI001AA102E3|nr:FoF1 ATP synthase subunit delta [Extibacter sp. GGCC_0201]MBO1719925.1 F0F1 ATP synthase subunit delta [Extibacter sp. GGCC_0201]BDF35650.1 hypothetical protein CE91St61_37250 [Lachnospiraceae bacterium]BDF39652.1 hypothetical protein CE91St62_37130 [Lachnospiraceae bacterium]
MKTANRNGERRSMTAIRYAAVLAELDIPQDLLARTSEILRQSSGLSEALESPVIQKEAKHRVIDRIFPAAVRNFLKVATDCGKIGYVPESIDVYRARMEREAGIVAARLVYAEPPSGGRLAKMEQFICRRYRASGVRWRMEEDKSLMGGFLLNVDGREYDYTVRGRLKRLEQKLTWR